MHRSSGFFTFVKFFLIFLLYFLCLTCEYSDAINKQSSRSASQSNGGGGAGHDMGGSQHVFIYAKMRIIKFPLNSTTLTLCKKNAPQTEFSTIVLFLTQCQTRIPNYSCNSITKISMMDVPIDCGTGRRRGKFSPKTKLIDMENNNEDMPSTIIFISPLFKQFNSTDNSTVYDFQSVSFSLNDTYLSSYSTKFYSLNFYENESELHYQLLIFGKSEDVDSHGLFNPATLFSETTTTSSSSSNNNIGEFVSISEFITTPATKKKRLYLNKLVFMGSLNNEAVHQVSTFIQNVVQSNKTETTATTTSKIENSIPIRVIVSNVKSINGTNLTELKFQFPKSHEFNHEKVLKNLNEHHDFSWTEKMPNHIFIGELDSGEVTGNFIDCDEEDDENKTPRSHPDSFYLSKMHYVYLSVTIMAVVIVFFIVIVIMNMLLRQQRSVADSLVAMAIENEKKTGHKVDVFTDSGQINTIISVRPSSNASSSSTSEQEQKDE